MKRPIRKVDGNQKEIVDTLRDYGYKVESTHILGKGLPDIIVAGWHEGTRRFTLLWVEIKQLYGDLTEDENRFFREWQEMPVLIAFHARDVMRWFEDKRWKDV